MGGHEKFLELIYHIKNSLLEEPSPELYLKYLGGKGLAEYYLLPHISKEWAYPSMPLYLFLS